MTLILRDFQPRDLEASLRLYRASFSEELRAQGHTPDSASRRLRLMARGRMIPFRLLTQLMGDVWGVLVAESQGELVGFGAYYGDLHSIELGPLMVAPEHRRRGIGRALLVARLERLTALGIRYATTSVLAGNTASLGNLDQQGFAVYGELTEFDVALPLNDGPTDLRYRPARPQERADLQALELAALGARRLAIEDSYVKHFYPTVAERLFNRLLASQTRRVVVENKAGQAVGLLTLATDRHSTKAHAPYLIAGAEPSQARAMVGLAAAWAMGHRKQVLRVTWPGRNRPWPELPVLADEWHWRLLVKELRQP